MNADLKEAAGPHDAACFDALAVLRHAPRRASSSRQRRSAAWASRPGALAARSASAKIAT